MPVLAKFCGIVIRRLVARTFGVHLHAIYGEHELVIGLHPVHIIQGDAPAWVKEMALDWVRTFQAEVE